jgi:hypothetical protein
MWDLVKIDYINRMITFTAITISGFHCNVLTYFKSPNNSIGKYCNKKIVLSFETCFICHIMATQSTKLTCFVTNNIFLILAMGKLISNHKIIQKKKTLRKKIVLCFATCFIPHIMANPSTKLTCFVTINIFYICVMG